MFLRLPYTSEVMLPIVTDTCFLSPPPHYKQCQSYMEEDETTGVEASNYFLIYILLLFILLFKYCNAHICLLCLQLD